MDNDLSAKTLKNIGFNASARVAMLLLSAAASVILARNLSASDYGIVGFAMIFIGFLTEFSDLGISSAVIQKSQLDEKGLYTGFTIRGALGIAIFAICFLFAPLAKLFCDNEAVVVVIRVLSLNFLIGSFTFLPSSLLTRALNYRKLVVPQVVAAILNFLVSIVLALNGFKYWSIVVANLFAAMASVIIINLINPVKIRFYFDKKRASELVHFGMDVFFSGIVIFCIFNADNFIIGTVRGPKVLGYYAVAFNWGALVSGILFTTVHTVLFPTFSKMQQDRDGIKAAYLKILEYVSFAGVLANLTLLVISKEFLIYILGRNTQKWLPALTSLRILCIYGLVRTLLEPVGQVIMGIGRTRLLLKANLVAAIIELALLFPALKYFGIEGVATIATVAYASQYFVFYPQLKRDLNLRLQELWDSVAPAIYSSGVLILIFIVYEKILSGGVITLFQKMVLSLVSYSLLYGFITKWKIIKESRVLLSKIL
jgi:lipopolysaccharide exporter